MRFLLAALVVSLASCRTPSAPEPRPPVVDTDPLVATIDQIVSDAITAGTAPGITIGIARRGKPPIIKGYGVASLTTKAPAEAETIYRIASLTKQFTAAAIVLLSEQGTLRLDDPLTQYVELAAGDRKVTLRHLLNQTSGIPSYTDQDAFEPTKRVTPAELVALIKDKPLEFEPGSRHVYSNTNSVLLGMVIEKVTGQSYAAYLAQAVFPRAGLTSTAYCDEASPQPKRAAGHAMLPTGGFGDEPPIDMSTPYASGALCSTVPDLLRWSEALASGKVVSAAGYQQMTTPPAIPAAPTEYGFGLIATTYEGHRTIWHNGAINGFVSELHTFPDDGVTVTILANVLNPGAARLVKTLARVALDIPSKTKPLPDDVRDAVLGTYELPGLGKTEIVVDQGVLVIAPPGQPRFPLEYEGNDTFAVPDVAATLVFVREAGAVTKMTVTQGGQTLDGPRVP